MRMPRCHRQYSATDDLHSTTVYLGFQQISAENGKFEQNMIGTYLEQIEGPVT